MKHSFKLSLTAASVMFLLHQPASIAANKLVKTPIPSNLSSEPANTHVISDTVEVMIELDVDATPSMIGKQDAKSDAKAVKDNVRANMAGLRAKENPNKGNRKNLNFEVSRDDVSRIAAMPGVKSVSYVVQETPNLTNSVPWIHAPEAWAILGGDGDNGSGDPMRIAVIDTGTDYYHADFGGDGNPADWASDDPTIIEPGTFPTAKVVDGFDFAGPSAASPTPDADPIDRTGHGTHVSGISVGIGVDANLGPGVAPGALLHAYKVFGDTSDSTGLSSLAINRAADPNNDGDTSDHVDAMNLSLGSDFGMMNSSSVVAANAASLAGSVVVISAGNDGNIPYIHGGPAVAPEAVSVASSVAGGEQQGAIFTSEDEAANGEFRAAEGAHANRFSDGYVISGNVEVADPLFGCEPLANAATIAGNVALIQRGGCAFDIKYAMAEAAGATGLVVYNDGAAPDRIEPIIMGGIDPSRNLTGIMISSTNGDAVNAAISGGTPVSVFADINTKVPTNPAFDDTLSGFTSRGPGDKNTFKPDLAAPGQAIVSAGVGSGTGTRTLNGTSMAAPHVAGLAGLLRQKWPDLPSAAIKSMMMNSSTPAYIDGAGSATQPYPLSLQGVGRVQADEAALLTSYTLPAGVSFGRANPHKNTNYKQTIQVVNLGDTPRTYSVSHEPNQTMEGVSMSMPSTVSVGPGKTQTMQLMMKFDPTNSPWDLAGNSQAEVDGWVVLTEEGGDTLRVGYMAVTDPASLNVGHATGSGIEIKNSGRGAGFSEGFTLVGTGGSPDAGAEAFAIESFGFRNAPVFGVPGVEFVVTSNAPWTSLSPYIIQIEIDNNEDGTPDHFLRFEDPTFDGEVDRRKFPGSTPSSVWSLGVADYDLNDRTVIGGFVRDVNGLGAGVPNIGFMEPGDSTFDYTLIFFNTRTGESTAQSGSVDLNQEITVDQPTVGLVFRDVVNINRTSANGGEMIWVHQQNAVDSQTQILNVN